MKDFAAIDFETANSKRTSICSVGVVIVRDGEIVETIYQLVRPTPNFYSGFCTAVHGMTIKDTERSNLFPAVWHEIASKIEGLPLVAHNRTFDEGCLKAVHNEYGIEYPNYEFHCTLQASRKIFAKQLPNHQLHTVSAHCGFILEKHHHALADAEACAMIALKIL